MTTAVTDDVRRSSRESAERHLRALVGRGDAVLREDQWAAIEALAVDRRRALVVQRTGWGKSAVYFVATLLLREQGAGPTVIVSPLLALMRNQIAAAERAGIRAVTINSTNIDQWQPIHDQIARRRGRRAAGEPRAPQQPGVPRRGAAPTRRELRTAGRRRGPLHLRLGPRLPSRLPPPAHPPGRAAGWHPGARHHGHRQRPRHRRRGRAARCPRRRRPGPRAVRRGAGAAGHARPRLAPAGSREAQDARAAARLAGRPPRRAARLRHRLLPHRGRDPGGRVLPPRPGAWRSRPTPARPSPGSARRWSRTWSTGG